MRFETWRLILRYSTRPGNKPMHPISLATTAMKVITSTLILCFCISSASAFETLTPAQTQIYDYPHLSGTKENMSIAYRYSGTSPEDITDTVKIHIGKENAERRDVEVDFLTAERRMHLPPFPGYRGNPVIIVMLEHIAQTFGKISGGGALYFRNRIRSSLAEKELEVISSKQQLNGQTIEIRTISFKPFQSDPNLAATPHLQEAVLSIKLSDDILAGLQQISIESPKPEGAQPFKQTLTFNPQPAE